MPGGTPTLPPCAAPSHQLARHAATTCHMILGRHLGLPSCSRGASFSPPPWPPPWRRPACRRPAPPPPAPRQPRSTAPTRPPRARAAAGGGASRPRARGRSGRSVVRHHSHTAGSVECGVVLVCRVLLLHDDMDVNVVAFLDGQLCAGRRPQDICRPPPRPSRAGGGKGRTTTTRSGRSARSAITACTGSGFMHTPPLLALRAHETHACAPLSSWLARRTSTASSAAWPRWPPPPPPITRHHPPQRPEAATRGLEHPRVSTSITPADRHPRP